MQRGGRGGEGARQRGLMPPSLFASVNKPPTAALSTPKSGSGLSLPPSPQEPPRPPAPSPDLQHFKYCGARHRFRFASYPLFFGDGRRDPLFFVLSPSCPRWTCFELRLDKNTRQATKHKVRLGQRRPETPRVGLVRLKFAGRAAPARASNPGVFPALSGVTKDTLEKLSRPQRFSRRPRAGRRGALARAKRPMLRPEAAARAILTRHARGAPPPAGRICFAPSAVVRAGGQGASDGARAPASSSSPLLFAACTTSKSSALLRKGEDDKGDALGDALACRLGLKSTHARNARSCAQHF